MSDWDDPVQRAAVWYVAVFGAAAVLLVTGANITSFDWSEAAHPLAAVVVIGASVMSAMVVVILAARVLTPRHNLNSLVRRQRKAEQPGVTGRTWQDVASGDRVLRKLVGEDFLIDDAYAPIAARATAFDLRATATERAAAMQRCATIVESANRRTAANSFHLLRWVTPIAAAVVLAGALSWSGVSQPEGDNASSKHPISVHVQLVPGVDPRRILGPNCTSTTYTGVAVAGSVSSGPLVVLDADGDCPARLLRITDNLGWVSSGR